ncbi:MAG: carboxypeptidase regulatory-like domain-containing protein [Pyrinomonadaceae bacterium]
MTGRLAESNGTGTSGVQVALAGSQTTTATTDAQGNYSFPNLIEGGNFRVTPTAGSNYVVTPQATTVKSMLSDSTVNFTTVPLYSISGTVKNSSGAAITGALVSVAGSTTGFVTTDSNGAYSLNGLRADGTYTLTPSRTHYGFTPPSSTFNTLPGNQTANFVGTLLTHNISGRVIDNFGVGISGATINLSGSQASTTTTDSNGNYSFTNLTAGGNYLLTPVMKYLTFSPPNANFFDLSGNWSNMNFTGTRATYSLGGVVLDNGGNPMSGVLLTLGGARSGTTVTNASGNYFFTSLPAGGNYNVSAAKWNYVFNPASRDSNDLSESRTLNYIGTQDAAQFFVRQHYSDFLGREADAAGLTFWTGEINGCGSDAACIEVKRVNVSAAFFLSIEFQNTGYLVERIYKVAYGDAAETSTGLVVPIIRRDEFMQDTPLISAGLVVGQGNWQATLDANKDAFAQTFVQRPRFTNIYGALSPAQFVDKLNTNAGGVLADAERTSLVNELTANDTVAGRASVLRKVAENGELDRREKSRAFVLMQYFGYLRRNPSDAPENNQNFAGWKFWLDKLNQFDGNFVKAEMVKAFITSDEYRHRFGQ